eukprot:scaffold259671_cov21-Tisochrysis_lutea.AAC.1
MLPCVARASGYARHPTGSRSKWLFPQGVWLWGRFVDSKDGASHIARASSYKAWQPINQEQQGVVFIRARWLWGGFVDSKDGASHTARASSKGSLQVQSSKGSCSQQACRRGYEM